MAVTGPEFDTAVDRQCRQHDVIEGHIDPGGTEQFPVPSDAVPQGVRRVGLQKPIECNHRLRTLGGVTHTREDFCANDAGD